MNSDFKTNSFTSDKQSWRTADGGEMEEWNNEHLF